jgi:hypothetical protein
MPEGLIPQQFGGGKTNMQDMNQFPRHVTWQEADKSWLKARGRSLRSALDSVTVPRDGASRYVVAAIATIALASSVGLSGVIAGPDAGKVIGSSLNPISGAVERLSGAPGSGAPATAEASADTCGEVAADTANTDTNADVDVQASPDTPLIDVAPILDGGIPLDIPNVPPVGDPPVIGDPPTDPPTDEPPVVGDPPTDPPTDTPPTDDPPTDDPPTGDPPPTDNPPADSGDDLIGADVNLVGQDVLDVGLLSGGLLDANADSLDPNGSGTGTDFGVDLTGDQIAGGTVDPQDDGVVDANVAGTDVSGSDVTDSVNVGSGDPVGTVENVVEDTTGTDPVSSDPVGDLVGDDPVGDLLGDDGLGGLLN